MTKTNGQGQSGITRHKEDAFLGIFRMNLAVQKKSRYRYHHFDLNAGCGYNYEAGCPGSPLIFLAAAAQQEITDFSAHFVDRRPEAVRELLTRIEDPRCTVYHGDNREFIEAIPGLIRLDNERPDLALGSVLWDPNGIDLPFAELIQLSRLCPRLDFILNYSARAFKRERGAGYISPELFLSDQLKSLNKRYWLIQDPLDGDRHEWMILVGRNYRMDVWKSMRLYNLDSAKGQECLRRSLSRRESTYSLF